jgi:hypothetical protein
MLTTIAWVSLILAVISFALFAYFLLKPPAEPVKQAATTQAAAAANVDVVELIKALASLTDSLAKAGPTVMLLVGAIFFLVISAVCGGLEELPAALNGGGAD